MLLLLQNGWGREGSWGRELTFPGRFGGGEGREGGGGGFEEGQLGMGLSINDVLRFGAFNGVLDEIFVVVV